MACWARSPRPIREARYSTNLDAGVANRFGPDGRTHSRGRKDSRSGLFGDLDGQKGQWCPGPELNQRHCDFQSHALPTELPGLCLRGARPMRSSALIGGRSAGCKRVERPTPGSFRHHAPVLMPCAFVVLIRRLMGNVAVLLVIGFSGDRIASREPAAKVDIGAMLRAERLELRCGQLAADRAWREAWRGIGHHTYLSTIIQDARPLSPATGRPRPSSTGCAGRGRRAYEARRVSRSRSSVFSTLP